MPRRCGPDDPGNRRLKIHGPQLDLITLGHQHPRRGLRTCARLVNRSNSGGDPNNMACSFMEKRSHTNDRLAIRLNDFFTGSEAKPLLFGQDWNDEAWAVCKSDMLIKGEDADNIILGDTFSKDGFAETRTAKRSRSTTCWRIRRSAWNGSRRPRSSRKSTRLRLQRTLRRRPAAHQ